MTVHPSSIHSQWFQPLYIPNECHQLNFIDEQIEAWASQMALVVKNPPAKAGTISWVGEILWRRKWQATPVFLPGKSHNGLWSMGSQSQIQLSDWAQIEAQIIHNFSKAKSC